MPEHPGVRRHERVPVLGPNERRGEHDEQAHDDELDEHDCRVDPRRLLDSDNEDGRHQKGDEHRRQVHDGACVMEMVQRLAPDDGCARPGLGQLVAGDVLHEGHDVPRPPDAHRRGTDQILEHQVPPDDPRHELAHRRVGIGVGAPGDRDHRGHLRIAKPRERGRGTRHDERQGDRRPRVRGGGTAGQHEDPRPDDRPDTQHGEIERVERPP